MSDFVKNEDAEFVTQINTFAEVLNRTATPNGSTVDFSAAEIAEAVKDAKHVLYVHQQVDKSKGFAQSFTKYKNDLRYGSVNPVTEPVFELPATVPPAVTAGVEDRFRQRAARIKAHGNYTPGFGEELKIVAAAVSVELGLPEFTVVMTAGHPVIKWKKKQSHGVQIWKDRGDDKGFVLVDTDLKSPWADKDELPEQGKTAIWQYKLIYIIDGEPVGSYSPPVTVTVHGEVTEGTRVVTN
jgi:hypothetical protein